jgi:hypothetical protein
MRLCVRLIGIAILTAAVVHPAFAKPKCEINETDGKSLLKSAKACGFQITNQGIGKKAPAPKKVAIASFQIRFDYVSQKYGYVMHDSFTGVTTEVTEQTYLQWEEEVYQELTDKMYDMFVQTLGDQGIEVVAVDAVKGSELYRGLKADSGSKEKKKKMIRMTAYGLIFKAGEQLIYNESVRVRENPGFWKWRKKYSGDLESYLRATVTLFGWVSEVGLRSWDASVNK